MRERIKVELSEVFQKEILLPAMLSEFAVGFEEMIHLNKAYAIMLAEKEIIDRKTAGILLQGLTKVSRELTAADLSGKYEDLYYNLEHALFSAVGKEIGGRLHTGRSRNDIYATLGRMEVRKSLWDVLKRNTALQDLLLRQAAENIDTVITGYTHCQPAQPITFAHYCTAVVQALRRDFERLKSAYRTTNMCPYGAAALAGTVFPIDRQRLSDLLGFEGVLINTLDCVGARDYLLEAEAACAIMMVTISRVAQDLYLWATNEFGLLEVGGEIAISSSIMPQKKNPISLELAKAKAAHSLGALVSSAAVLRSTPFSLCMDLSEASTLYWDARQQTLQAIELILETLRYSRIRKDRAVECAQSNFSTATALADLLVMKCGASFSEAHSIVGEMVGTILDTGGELREMHTSLLRAASMRVLQRELVLTDAEIRRAVDPCENVAAKLSLGGPSRSSVKEMISDAESQFRSETAWLQGEINRVVAAYRGLAERERQLLELA